MFFLQPFRALILVAGVFAIQACSNTEQGFGSRDLIQLRVDSAAASARSSDASDSEQARQREARPKAEYFHGDGVFTKQASIVRQLQEDGEEGVSLTFKNADIRIVVQAVLGDTLGLSYAIDPRIQGNATLETSGAISRTALRDTLETLLKTKGYALLDTADGLQVLPLADAPRRVSEIRRGLPASVNLPGFGVQVVPLKFTAPTAMRELLEPFSPAGGILRADNARNFLIVGGTSQELTSMMRAIETFDVNWMAGMSFAIYSIKYAEVADIVDELTAILESDGSPLEGLVRFIPIPRINKLLAISANKDTLQNIEFWIEKLDLGESSPGRRIYVYQVKNGRAVDMANALNLILGTQFRAGEGSLNSFGTGLSGTSGSARFPGNQGGRRNGGNTRVDNRNGLEERMSQAGIRIVPNEENNSIMMLATPTELGVIEAALRQIDVMPRQVLVEVTLAEVTLSDELRYGLQWHFEFGENSVSFGKSAQPTSEFPGFSWGYTNNSSASAVLNALEAMTDVQVVSSPKLLVLNNQSAHLQVGDEIPVPVASAVSTNDSNAPIVNSIEYRTTGVILTITPRINEGGLIMLDIEQEVSNVVETSSSGIDAPTIQQRRITSTVAVQDGTTVALGGLIRTSLNDVKSGVPLLKDIPLLGAAFSDNNIVERRSELVILMTPRIIRDVQEQREVMDYLQREFRSLIAPTNITN